MADLRHYLVAAAAVVTLGAVVYAVSRRGGSSGHSNPSPRAAALPVPLGLPDGRMVEEKVRELVERGYPESLARKAISWAQGWSLGMATKLGLPEYAGLVYPRALALSERWVEGLWGMFK